MIANLKPYQAYKPTGLTRLGSIPEHWGVRRLKSLCAKCALYGANVTATSYSPTGVRFLRTTDITEDGQLKPGGVFLPAALVSDYILVTGDLLISRSGTIGRSFLYDAARHGRCAYAGYLVRYVPNPDVLPRFLFWFTKTLAFSKFLKEMAISSTIENVSGEKYANSSIPLPPLSEQTCIIRFLDHADRRIRRYIFAKRQMISSLEELRKTLIRQAISGQIDTRNSRPYPAYKTTASQWLNAVPKHWKLRRLRFVTRLQRGYDLPADQRTPGSFPVVSSGGVIDTHSVSKCSGPGVAMGRYGSTEAVFYIEQDYWPHNTSLFVTDFHGNNTKWCYYLLSTITKADHAGKSAVPGLDRKDLFEIVVPVPSVDEQERIAQAIDGATRQVADAISVAERGIEAMREYRDRIIEDVVTGNVDVREVVSSLRKIDTIAAEARL